VSPSVWQSFDTRFVIAATTLRSTSCGLRLWVEAERADNRNPNVGEWWQWVYEPLEADPDPGKRSGAHVAYRDRKAR
jgi:hypothetical protein